MMAVNLRGLFFMSQAVARVMIGQGEGRIINQSSQGGLVGLPEAAVYCASKGGVNTLTKQLALEWAPHGAPSTPSPRHSSRHPAQGRSRGSGAPSRRALADPIGPRRNHRRRRGRSDYLASDAGRMLTGTILSVDGGWTAQ